MLCCAMAGITGITIGCKPDPESKPSLTQSEAVAAFESRLVEADKAIADLKEKAEKATGDEKVQLEAKRKEAAGLREALAKKTSELKAATADKWESVKQDADAAFEAFNKQVK